MPSLNKWKYTTVSYTKRLFPHGLLCYEMRMIMAAFAYKMMLYAVWPTAIAGSRLHRTHIRWNKTKKKWRKKRQGKNKTLCRYEIYACAIYIRLIFVIAMNLYKTRWFVRSFWLLLLLLHGYVWIHICYMQLFGSVFFFTCARASWLEGWTCIQTIWRYY